MKKSCYVALLVCLSLAIVFPMSVSADSVAPARVKDANEFKTAVESDSITSIVLDDDLDLSDYGVMDLSNCTVDLNNHTITGTHFTYIFEGHDFVLKNGKITSKNVSSYPLFIGDMGANNTNIVIDNIKIPDGGINIYNAEVTLKNMDITARNFYAIWCDENAQVTVESGTYKATTGPALIATAKGDVGASLSLKGGNYIDNGKPFFLQGDDRAKPVITGGTYSSDVSEFVPEEFRSSQKGADFVIAPVATSIKLSAKTLKIEKGKSNLLKATITPANSLDKVTWESGDDNIATVDENGNVTANAVGNTAITATANDKTSSCEVTVYETKEDGNSGNTDPSTDAPKTGDNGSVLLFLMIFGMTSLALGISVFVEKN